MVAHPDEHIHSTVRWRLVCRTSELGVSGNPVFLVYLRRATQLLRLSGWQNLVDEWSVSMILFDRPNFSGVFGKDRCPIGVGPGGRSLGMHQFPSYEGFEQVIADPDPYLMALML